MLVAADLSSYEPLAVPPPPPTDGDRARLIVAGLSRLGLGPGRAADPAGGAHSTASSAVLQMDGGGGDAAYGRSKPSANMTECVTVPSSEHVAEIVGRQG